MKIKDVLNVGVGSMTVIEGEDELQLHINLNKTQ